MEGEERNIVEEARRGERREREGERDDCRCCFSVNYIPGRRHGSDAVSLDKSEQSSIDG